MLTRLRSVLPAQARERLYVIVAPIVALLASAGLLDANTVPSITALALSIVTLLFAALHGTSPKNTAIYGVLAAAAAVFGAYGIATEEQWSLVLFVAASLLGVARAASKARPPIEVAG